MTYNKMSTIMVWAAIGSIVLAGALGQSTLLVGIVIGFFLGAVALSAYYLAIKEGEIDDPF